MRAHHTHVEMRSDHTYYYWCENEDCWPDDSVFDTFGYPAEVAQAAANHERAMA